MKDPETPMYIREKVVKVDGNHLEKIYKKLKMLGKGGFAECYDVVETQSNKHFACKFISKAKISRIKCKNRLMLEIKLHRALHHPNIVQFHNVF
jgi:polo-like kinase 1